jgi:uncharacterized protein with HEPN domain
MSRDPQRLQDYLKHILIGIKRIQEYCSDIDEIGFLKSQLIQDAVIRNFEIIGEASKNIERLFPDFAAAHPELPLMIAYEMRNALPMVTLKSICRLFGKQLKLIFLSWKGSCLN